MRKSLSMVVLWLHVLRCAKCKGKRLQRCYIVKSANTGLSLWLNLAILVRAKCKKFNKVFCGRG
ncbi:MAG: hypothetical protein Q3971_05145 [Moraxella sp.]|nr:hypothetical protein [Moraxella sp.]